MSDHSRISRPILPGFTRGQTASRWTALLLLACYLPACSSWQVRGEPVPLIVADHPAEIQVTLDDGSKVMLKQPVIRGDTLSGLASRPTWNSPDSPTILATAPMSIALANIRHVALPGFSIGRDAGFDRWLWADRGAGRGGSCRGCLQWEVHFVGIRSGNRIIGWSARIVDLSPGPAL